MSKVVDSRQLVAYIQQNGLLPDLQSAYRRCRSTETAVLEAVAAWFTHSSWSQWSHSPPLIGSVRCLWRCGPIHRHRQAVSFIL